MRFVGITRQWFDGYGPLWIYRDASGLEGVVQARTFEDAYSVIQDEILDGCTWEEMLDHLGMTEAELGAEVDRNGGGLPEGFEYRSSGNPSSPWAHGEIAMADLNGESLEELTPQLFASLNVDRVARGMEPYRIELETGDEIPDGWRARHSRFA